MESCQNAEKRSENNEKETEIFGEIRTRQKKLVFRKVTKRDLRKKLNARKVDRSRKYLKKLVL